LALDGNGTLQVPDVNATDTVTAGSGFYTSDFYYVNNIQVVGPRRTGWAAPTGTVSRATFNPATVTTEQLAQRFAAMYADLAAHGLVGP